AVVRGEVLDDRLAVVLESTIDDPGHVFACLGVGVAQRDGVAAPLAVAHGKEVQLKHQPLAASDISTPGKVKAASDGMNCNSVQTVRRAAPTRSSASRVRYTRLSPGRSRASAALSTSGKTSTHPLTSRTAGRRRASSAHQRACPVRSST